MKLDQARVIVTRWNTPLGRAAYWYLVIPALLTVGQVDVLNARNARGWPWRWVYLLRAALWSVLLWQAVLWPASGAVWLLRSVLIYLLLVDAVWALAWWSLRRSPQAGSSSSQS